MNQIAPGLWQLTGFPRYFLNTYFSDGILFDAATRWAQGRILAELRAHPLRLVALTHCHPDHQGVAAAVCTSRGVPLACHEADVPAMEGRVPMQPSGRIVRLGVRLWAGPPFPVRRMLTDGDRLGDFRVVHAPGHTAGHVIFFRDSDRVAIAGDVLANIHFLTGRPGLRQPPGRFCVNAAQNRRSIGLLANLNPSLVCFGHGPPLRELSRLHELARRLLATA